MLALIASLSSGQLQAQQDSVARPGFSIGVIHADSVARAAPVRTFSDLLTGRLAGVEVISTSGTVGAASRILIRGAGSLSGTPPPLVYIDGMRVDADASALTIAVGGLQVSRLDDLDPQDVATIEVLRGSAATALYGTGASCGVILVTTKRGASGPLRLHAYSSQGVTYDPHRFPDNYASGPTGLLTYQPLENPATSPFRTGYLSSYGLDASGGEGRATFYAAGRWDATGGVYGLPDAERTRIESTGGFHPEVANPSNLGRVSLRGNGRFQLSERAEVAVSAAYLSSDLRLPNNDNSTIGLLANGLLGSGDSSVNQGWRLFPPGTLLQVVNSEAVDRFTGSVRADVRPASFLAVHALAGVETVQQTDNELQRNGEGPSFSGTPSQGSVTESRVRFRRPYLRASTVGFFTPSEALRLQTSLGVEYFTDREQHEVRSGRILPPGSTSIDDAALQSASGETFSERTLGIFVEQRATIRSRLFFGAAARWERVTPGLGIASTSVYPRVDVSWLAPAPVGLHVDTLRLRAAYGRAGGRPLLLPPLFLPPGVPSEVASLAKPAGTGELELGADAALLSGRVSLGVTYYHKSVQPQVVVPSPPSGGLLYLVERAGHLTNTGVEITLGATLIHASTLLWEATVTAWGNRNRLNGVAPGVSPFLFGSQRFENGLPAGSYVIPPILGYQDLNGDGRISSSEVTVGSTPVFAGTPFPTQGGSLGTTVTLHGRLQAAALLEYRGGNAQLNSTEWFRCAVAVCRAAVDPTTPLAEQAKAAASVFTTSGFIDKADFVKLRELSLTYLAPDAWAAHLGAHGLTLTVAARNVATWTSYRGLDPEVNAAAAESFTVEDFFTQPPVRTAFARLDITF